MQALRANPEQLPKRLYRVQYLGCRSLFASHFQGADKADLVAADSTTSFSIFHVDAAFQESVQDHINWVSQKQLPFVALFSSKGHALNWALRFPWKHRNGNRNIFNWCIYTIDTALLRPDTYIFNLDHLHRHLHLDPAAGFEAAVPNTAGTFLILHRVPGTEFVKGQQLNDILEGMVDVWLKSVFRWNKCSRLIERAEIDPTLRVPDLSHVLKIRLNALLKS